jgi:hypothetical protein
MKIGKIITLAVGKKQTYFERGNMKIVGKILKLIVLIVVIVLVAAVVAFHLYSGQIIKSGVKTAASNALKVGVDINDISLSILGGSVAINGLIINNPPGYTYKNLLELNKTDIAVNIRSLIQDTVHIKEIKLDGMDLVIEQKGFSNNLQEIIKALPDEKTQQGQAPAGKKLVIDDLEITNIRVKVKMLPVPGKADTVSLNLAPIKMTNLGGDNKLDMAKLSAKIMVAITQGIVQQGAGLLPGDMLKTMNSTLGEVTNIGKAAVEEGKKAIESGTGILKGATDLLKPKK